MEPALPPMPKCTEAPLNQPALLIPAALAEASSCAEHSQTGCVCYQPQSIIPSQPRPSVLAFSPLSTCFNSAATSCIPSIPGSVVTWVKLISLCCIRWQHRRIKGAQKGEKANMRSKLHVNNFWFELSFILLYS